MNTPLPPIADDELVRSIVETAYTEFVESQIDATLLTAHYPTAANCATAAAGGAEALARVVDGLSEDDNLRLRRCLLAIMQEACMRLESEIFIDRGTVASVRQLCAELGERAKGLTELELADHFFSPIQLRYLEAFYCDLQQTSLKEYARATMKRAIPDIRAAIQLFGSTADDINRMLGFGKSASTSKKIISILEQLREALHRVAGCTDAEARQLLIDYDYPFLKSADRKFTADYITSYGHAPNIFLLRRYLSSSAKQYNRMMSDACGLTDGKPKTGAEIARRMGITAERAAQLKTNFRITEAKTLRRLYPVSVYPELDASALLTENSAPYREIASRGETDCLPFVATAKLLQEVSHFAPFQTSKGWIAVDNKLIDFNCIENLLRKIERLRKTRRGEAGRVGIWTLMEGIDASIYDKVKPIVAELACYICDATRLTDDHLLLPANILDPTIAVYDILKAKGKPMHISEILARYRELYPTAKPQTAYSLRVKIYAHPHIVPLGKKSTYALDSWPDIYSGTIRDVVYQTLRRSDSPMHIDMLMTEVRKHYPTTTPRSVLSSLMTDSKHRFKNFGAKVVGLARRTYGTASIASAHDSKGQAAPTFEQRLEWLRAFGERCHRMPMNIAEADPEERRMSIWFALRYSGSVEIKSEEGRKAFDSLTADFKAKGWPLTNLEYSYLLKCDRIRRFVDANGRLPRSKDDKRLYAWLRSSMSDDRIMDDQRRRYFDEMMAYASGKSMLLFTD